MDHVSSQCEHDADGAFGGQFLKRRLPVILLLLAAIGFAVLGVWQVERRAWKLDLIARVDARIAAPPVALPARWSAIDARHDEYRRIRAEGHFIVGRDTLVQALTEQGAGFWVMAPLVTANGIVFVNRGFVPTGMRPPVENQAPAKIVGLLRMSQPGGGFLRSNDPAEDRWYSRDVAAIARVRHLANVAPFFIDADATANPGGYPVGGLTVVRFRNAHAVYAATWFALALMSVAGAFLFLRRDEA